MGGMVPCQKVDPYQSQRGMSGNETDNALMEPNLDPGVRIQSSPPTSWQCIFAYHIYQFYNHRSYYKIVSM